MRTTASMRARAGADGAASRRRRCRGLGARRRRGAASRRSRGDGARGGRARGWAYAHARGRARGRLELDGGHRLHRHERPQLPQLHADPGRARSRDPGHEHELRRLRRPRRVRVVGARSARRLRPPATPRRPPIPAHARRDRPLQPARPRARRRRRRRALPARRSWMRTASPTTSSSACSSRRRRPSGPPIPSRCGASRPPFWPSSSRTTASCSSAAGRAGAPSSAARRPTSRRSRAVRGAPAYPDAGALGSSAPTSASSSDSSRGREHFDEVVIAAHSDQALGMLADPSERRARDPRRDPLPGERDRAAHRHCADAAPPRRLGELELPPAPRRPGGRRSPTT